MTSKSLPPSPYHYYANLHINPLTPTPTKLKYNNNKPIHVGMINDVVSTRLQHIFSGVYDRVESLNAVLVETNAQNRDLRAAVDAAQYENLELRSEVVRLRGVVVEQLWENSSLKEQLTFWGDYPGQQFDNQLSIFDAHAAEGKEGIEVENRTRKQLNNLENKLEVRNAYIKECKLSISEFCNLLEFDVWKCIDHHVEPEDLQHVEPQLTTQFKDLRDLAQLSPEEFAEKIAEYTAEARQLTAYTSDPPNNACAVVSTEGILTNNGLVSEKIAKSGVSHVLALASNHWDSASLEQMMHMGYDPLQIEFAMCAASNKSDKAMGYLITGIPENVEIDSKPLCATSDTDTPPSIATLGREADVGVRVNAFDSNCTASNWDPPITPTKPPRKCETPDTPVTAATAAREHGHSATKLLHRSQDI